MIHTHFKGGTYTKLFEVNNSEQRDQVLVIYISHLTGRVWARPKTMFEELVKWPDGVTRPRFTPGVV